LRERITALDQERTAFQQQHHNSLQQLTSHCTKLQESKSEGDQEASDVEQAYAKQFTAMESAYIAETQTLSEEVNRLRHAHADLATVRGGERAAHATAVKEWGETRMALEGQVTQVSGELDRTARQLGQREALLLEVRGKADEESRKAVTEVQTLATAKANLTDRMSAATAAHERQSKELRYVIEQRENTILLREKERAEGEEKLKRVLASLEEQQEQLSAGRLMREELELELERRGKHHTGEFRTAVQGKEEALVVGKVGI
jgi:hypothetical protein